MRQAGIGAGVEAAEIGPLITLVDQARQAEAHRDGAAAVPALTIDGEGRVGLADCFRALRALSLRVGEETFTLSARPMMSGTAELVFSRAFAAPTLGAAMREIAHAYNVLHGAEYNRIEGRGRALAYVLDDEGFPYTRPRDGYLHFTLECALVFVHAALSELAGEDLGPYVRRVSTRRTRQAGGGPAGALDFWAAPVEYGAAGYSVAYAAEIAGRPLATRRADMPPDLAVHNRILSLIEARDVEARGSEGFDAAVRQALLDGLRDQASVAERLRVSPATLRRRLADRGVGFRTLLHRVLNEAAQRMIADGAAVGAAAETLGFSDVRSFTRAFKAWNGVTPSSWRSRTAGVSAPQH